MGKRDARTVAIDYQISNMKQHFGLTFVFDGKNVTMPVAALHERLGFAYSHGAMDMKNHIQAALDRPVKP